MDQKHQLQPNTFNSLKVDDTIITAKTVIKFLGAYLDEFLNMKTHIANRTKMHSITNPTKTSEDILLKTQ